MRESLELWAGVRSFREAADGSEAIEKARQRKPDLVVLDLAMPNMDGFQAARILKSMAPEVPLVLWTVHEVPLSEAEHAGFDRVVSKLEGLRALANCVVALLRKRAA
jgi:CheY-like chemotaxis protein